MGEKLKIENIPTSGFSKGSHHPTCPRHHNHLIWYNNRAYCLGCTCMYSGVVIGFLSLIIFFLKYEVNIKHYIICSFALLIPTIIQPWLQMKSFKILSRLCLGISLSLVSSSFYFMYWHFNHNILDILIYISSYSILGYSLYMLRKIKLNDPCVNCPEGVYPLCNWNLKNLKTSDVGCEIASAIEVSNGKSDILIID
jgi:hypothetical protein